MPSRFAAGRVGQLGEPNSFAGFALPTSSTTYTPNQFFDVCLPHASRGCVRAVGFLIRTTLGWCDEHGNPTESQTEVRRRTRAADPAYEPPTPEQLAELQAKLQRRSAQSSSDCRLQELLEVDDDLLGRYLHQRQRRAQADSEELAEQLQQQKKQVDLLQHLQHEYRQKGSAAVYTFSICSSLQVARDQDEFARALRAVTQEIRDQHRYHITQKLQGGRLNIQLVEADQPAIAWIEQWFGGTLSPTQLERIEQAGYPLPVPQDHVMVTPNELILSTDGHILADTKRIGARVLSTMVSRLDRTESEVKRRALAATPSVIMPLKIGILTDEGGRDLGPAVLPLEQLVHVAVSGTTGSGKSYFARVLVEEAALIDRLGVLVLDPRSPFSGMLIAEDRPAVLSHYASFDMDTVRARGFDFAYYAPARHDAPLPNELSSLTVGRTIVSLKGLNDTQRCGQAADILTSVFATLANQGESDHPRLLVTIDEAHLFTRKRMVDEDAVEAAARAEAAIDRLVREGRKYGIVMLLVTQSMKDFARDLASVRQMTSTKAFLRNSDNEIDYAADVLGNGRALVNLPTGTTLIHNAAWGVRRVRVRPPYSKVCELNDVEIDRLVRHPVVRRERAISSEAQTLLAVLRTHCAQQGPVNMSGATRLSSITSKRRLQNLVRELEQAGLLISRTLAERGSPRVIEPVADSVPAADESR